MKWTTWSAIFGTILIVVAIAAKLSGLGTAEPTAVGNLSWATTEKEVIWYYDGETTHRYSLDKPEPNETEPDPDEGFVSFMIDKKFPDLYKGVPVYEYQDGSRLNLYREPNEPKTYTAEELDEIYKDEPALGKLAKSLWGVSVEEDTISMQPQEKNFKAQFKEFFPDIEWEPNDMDEWWSNSITAFGLMLVEKRLERIEKSLIESEPNEPEDILICPEHHKRYCKICESIVYRGGWLVPFKGSYLYNKALQEKPEPKCEGHGVTAIYCPECHGELESLISGRNEPETARDWVIDIGSFIPTWPDYIELEKDLYFVRYDNNDVWQKYRKGTKIYFKE